MDKPTPLAMGLNRAPGEPGPDRPFDVGLETVNPCLRGIRILPSVGILEVWEIGVAL